MTDGDRERWLLRFGTWLSENGFEGHPHALGCAFFSLTMKGIGPNGPTVFGPAKPGSLAHRWAYAYSPARHHPAIPFELALRHELNAAAYVPPDTLGVPTRQHGPGHPLDAGVDYLAVVRELIVRGFEFPPGLLREGELELVAAFNEKTDAELSVEWNVALTSVRKRRQRLRRHLEEVIQVVRELPVPEPPTVIERLAWVEERVREHDRELGLVPDTAA
jgi:hypothetical protein